MSVPLHVLIDHRTVQNIEHGEEGRCTVALAIMRQGARDLQPQPNFVPLNPLGPKALSSAEKTIVSRALTL